MVRLEEHRPRRHHAARRAEQRVVGAQVRLAVVEALAVEGAEGVRRDDGEGEEQDVASDEARVVHHFFDLFLVGLQQIATPDPRSQKAMIESFLKQREEAAKVELSERLAVVESMRAKAEEAAAGVMSLLLPGVGVVDRV